MENIPEELDIGNWNVYTEEEVKNIVQQIYSEFAELPMNMHTTYFLKDIIKKEVEQKSKRPIKIFKD